SWVNQAVSMTGPGVGPDILRALERMAPAIRSLRLGDGAMVRFHGGAAGQAERVDQALADAGIRLPARPEGTMGYSRLSAARTLLIMDTGLLPTSRTGDRAHAGTLAFELSSGRVPVLVNMGPANGFEARMRSASRATAAHNGVDVAGSSLARFAGSDFVRRSFGSQLTDAPRRVTVKRDSNEHGQAILASHDGYSQTQGLIHSRQISVSYNGAEIHGVDRMVAGTTGQKVRFSKAAQRAEPVGQVPFSAHFHLHPDVSVDLDMGGAVASLTLSNGEIWILRALECDLELRDTIYFEQGRLKPRATKQIVATSAVVDYEGVINWTLSRPR
ncbi:MAG: heparinase II/III domain-containing protein, partial [Paracoccaceae bacterium]